MTDYPTKTERLKVLTDKLESGVAELFESDRFAAYLNTMSKFHHYSFGNVLLIAMQFPGASQVAGFHTWKKKFGRTVKKGEKGIQILAPCTFTQRTEQDKIDPTTQRPGLDDNGQPLKETAAVQCRQFRIEYVFDVSQTEGRELPTLNHELSGDVTQYNAIHAALKELSPVPIVFEPLPGTAKGCYSHMEQRIVIRPGMSQTQTLKTMIHEIAHAKLHSLPVKKSIVRDAPQKDRSTREVEAESVAYVVCQHFGIDTSDYSFGYVAGWSKGRELAELKSSLNCIRAAAAEIIGGIELKCPELAPSGPEYEKKAPAPRHHPRKRRPAPAR